MEKGYRHWGHDIGEEDTPFNAGLGFAVAMEKPGGFIGRDALAAQRAAGPVARRLVQVRLTDTDHPPLLLHHEPILRDGRIVGSITSGAYGHRIGASLGVGYVTRPGGVTADWLRERWLRGRGGAEALPRRTAAWPLVRPPGRPDPIGRPPLGRRKWFLVRADAFAKNPASGAARAGPNRASLPIGAVAVALPYCFCSSPGCRTADRRHGHGPERETPELAGGRPGDFAPQHPCQ
jgi:hypothetical protein